MRVAHIAGYLRVGYACDIHVVAATITAAHARLTAVLTVAAFTVLPCSLRSRAHLR